MKQLVLFAVMAAACGGPPPKPTTHVAPPAFACPEALPKLDVNAEAATLVGQVVDHVCVVGAGETVRSLAVSAVGTKTGDKLDTKRIRDDVRALLDLPTLDDVAAYATRASTGLTVYYAVRERPLIGALSFSGIHAFTEKELAAIPLAPGQRLDSIAIRTFVHTFEQAYADRAYGGAKVSVSPTPMDGGKVRVTVTVDEGPPWHFARLAFKGNKVLTTADLTATAGIADGDVWNAPRLERAGLLVQALAYNHGLVLCHVDVVRGDVAKDGTVPVTITLQEGDVFHLRKLSIAGVAPGVEKDLLGKLKMKPHALFVRDTLMADFESVRKQLGVEVEPETAVDPATKSIDIVLRAKAK